MRIELLSDVFLKFKLKRCSTKECCKQCRYVKFEGTMTNWPAQKPTQQHVEHQDATGIQKKNYFCVFF